jgi:hypothetical protein
VDHETDERGGGKWTTKRAKDLLSLELLRGAMISRWISIFWWFLALTVNSRPMFTTHSRVMFTRHRRWTDFVYTPSNSAFEKRPELMVTKILIRKDEGADGLGKPLALPLALDPSSLIARIYR